MTTLARYGLALELEGDTVVVVENMRRPVRCSETMFCLIAALVASDIPIDGGTLRNNANVLKRFRNDHQIDDGFGNLPIVPIEKSSIPKYIRLINNALAPDGPQLPLPGRRGLRSTYQFISK